jgi:Cu-Zn family superoxide dismutase
MPIGDPYRGPGSTVALARYDSGKPVVVFGSGTLTMPNSTSKAITYDRSLAPVGAALTATIIPTSEGSTAELTVFGLLPNRGYLVYAYTQACGATADAAGTRFQNRPDPGANARTLSADNEIGLEVRTDAAGAGTSHTTVPFVLTERAPGSMVVQDSKEGGRIACLTLSRR